MSCFLSITYFAQSIQWRYTLNKLYDNYFCMCVQYSHAMALIYFSLKFTIFFVKLFVCNISLHGIIHKSLNNLDLWFKQPIFLNPHDTFAQDFRKSYFAFHWLIKTPTLHFITYKIYMYKKRFYQVHLRLQIHVKLLIYVRLFTKPYQTWSPFVSNYYWMN
jgi:hypothetical protein